METFRAAQSTWLDVASGTPAQLPLANAGHAVEPGVGGDVLSSQEGSGLQVLGS